MSKVRGWQQMRGCGAGKGASWVTGCWQMRVAGACFSGEGADAHGVHMLRASGRAWLRDGLGGQAGAANMGSESAGRAGHAPRPHWGSRCEASVGGVRCPSLAGEGMSGVA